MAITGSTYGSGQCIWIGIAKEIRWLRPAAGPEVESDTPTAIEQVAAFAILSAGSKPSVHWDTWLAPPTHATVAKHGA